MTHSGSDAAMIAQSTDNSGDPSPSSGTSQPSPPSRWRHVSLRFGVLGVLVLLVAAFSAVRPHQFATAFNARTLLGDSATLIILATGLTFVVVSAGIDLSIGSVLVFASVIAAKAMVAMGGTSAGWGVILLGLLIAAAAGLAWGAVNGFLVARAKIPPLIVTLGSFGAALGLSQVITQGQDVQTVPARLTSSVGTGLAFGAVPWDFVLAAAIAITLGLLLAYTRFGRHTYAIGSNPEAARRAGINVARHLVKVYALQGTLAGVAGWVAIARFAGTTISGHGTDNLDAIAAVAIGGTSLFGGVGWVLGSVVGVFIPAVLQNGFLIVGVQAYWQQVAIGAVLVAAVYVDQFRRRAKANSLRAVGASVHLSAQGAPTRQKEHEMSRHVLTGSVCVTAVALLAACGSNSSTGAGSAGAGSTGSAPISAVGKAVTVVLGVKGFAYFTSLGCGAQAEGRKLGLNVSVQGASQFAAPAQIPIVNSVTAQKPAGAVVAVTDAKALVAPLQQMQSAGVKLVEVDTATSPALGVTQITSDNSAAGTLGAQTLATVMGGRGDVLIVSTAPGVSTEDVRIAAFKAAMRAYPGITVLSPQYDGANPEKSASVVSGVLAAHPNLGGIFTTNLLSTMGTETALKQTHKAGSTKFVGSDGAAAQLSDLQANVMQGIILQKPAQEGALAVDQIDNALTGKTVDPPQQVGVVALTKGNLAADRRFIYQSQC